MLMKFRRPPGDMLTVIIPVPDVLRLIEATSKVGPAPWGTGACACSDTRPAAPTAATAIRLIRRTVSWVISAPIVNPMCRVASLTFLGACWFVSDVPQPPHIYYNCRFQATPVFSVLCGSFDAVDDDHVDGPPRRFQLEAELFLQGGEQRGCGSHRRRRR